MSDDKEVEAKVEPLEVKVVNPSKVKKDEFEPVDDDMYDEFGITKEDLEEFEKEDGNTRS